MLDSSVDGCCLLFSWQQIDYKDYIFMEGEEIESQERDFSQWEIQQEIAYGNQLTKLYIRRKGARTVVEKTIFLGNDHDHRAHLEIELMQKIHSPHVAQYLGHVEGPNSLQLYMPYYSQGDLENYLLNYPHIHLSDRIDLFFDILVGLKELHSLFIIHRDLKLKNIFVDGQGRGVVGDLGVARVTQQASSVLGTIGYQAPEVYSNQKYDNKVDIWGMGVIAYQLLNPLRDNKIMAPFPGSFQSVFCVGNQVNSEMYKNKVSKVQPFDESVPKDLATVIGQMLEIDPQKRLSWVQLYEGGVLSQYDKEFRLATFMAEYKQLQYTSENISKYALEMELMEVTYFRVLAPLLLGENFHGARKKHPQLEKFRREVHIFFYLELKKVIDNFQYVRSKNCQRLVVEMKPRISQMRDALLEMEDRINLWLRPNKEPDIRINNRYLSSQYYQQVKTITDGIIVEIGQKQQM